MDLVEADGLELMLAGVDIIGLRQLGRYPVAASLLQIFAARDKASKETKLLRAYTLVYMARIDATSTQPMPDLPPLTIQDITGIFFSLQELGCGTLDTTPSFGGFGLFTWKTNLISVGRFATQDISRSVWQSLRDVAPAKLRLRWLGVTPFAGAETSTSLPPAFVVASPPLSHTFILRPGQFVNFSLPQDFTPAEATRLAKFIRTLPFGPSQNPAGEPVSTHLKPSSPIKTGLKGPQPITMKTAHKAS
jgi:hypothetical protein